MLARLHLGRVTTVRPPYKPLPPLTENCCPYPAGLDLGAEAHFNRPNVVFSRVNSDPSRDHPRWDEQRVYRACLRLIADGRLDGDEIVQPVVPFADLAEEYPKIADAPETLVKLGVDY